MVLSDGGGAGTVDRTWFRGGEAYAGGQRWAVLGGNDGTRFGRGQAGLVWEGRVGSGAFEAETGACKVRSQGRL